MAELVAFESRAKKDALINVRNFVELCREKVFAFGPSVDFDSNVWDVSERLQLKGHGNKRHRLYFCTLKSVDNKNNTPMREPFLSFSKGYIQYMQALRPTKNIAFRLSVMRVVERVLSEHGGESCPTRIDIFVLNRSAQIIKENYEPSTAYRISGQLELFAKFINEHNFTEYQLDWNSPIGRPIDTVRVGKEFDERRNEKMPSEAALDALPKIFRIATELPDILISSIAAILCCAPDRVNEVLLLPDNCEVNQDYAGLAEPAYGLRWWPAKGADPMVKWIAPTMVDVTKKAISKIREVTQTGRKIARWYDENPTSIYLTEENEHLRCKEFITSTEVASIIGLSNYAAGNTWCKGKGIKQHDFSGEMAYRFEDVESAILKMLPQGFPILDQGTGLRYSDALILIRANELHMQRGNYLCMIEPVTINQINSGLGSRVKFGFPSIFSRLGFTELDGSPIKVTTHQFRHWLNTLAQVGGLSQLDIAKWSGRSDIRQNALYDHTTPDQMLMMVRNAVGDSSKMFGPLAKIPKRALISRDEFARLRVSTAHTTEIGYCIHDYTMSPCQVHRDCIHCEDLVCVKGDQEKIARLKQSLDEAKTLLRKAEEAQVSGYVGSDRWADHHRSTIERISQICEIMDDPNVPLGAIIQLSPPKSKVHKQKIDIHRRLEEHGD